MIHVLSFVFLFGYFTSSLGQTTNYGCFLQDDCIADAMNFGFEELSYTLRKTNEKLELYHEAVAPCSAQLSGLCEAVINGSCLVVVPRKFTCAMKGGRLFEMHSDATQTFVADIAAEPRLSIWLGGSDEGQGQWQWVSTGENITMATDFWLPGQPDNGSEGENCLEMNVGAWNDDQCWREEISVCEILNF